ncbi:TIGR03086 family metal-binding protein [Kutzneria sp. CA-103260]|uniref:TIGR03086 family metal-binding protein n=1 Tax=Kutzneria sp. CA-103260 TaxID=2802641 RepID=UPI001BED59B1|nr:TIGR03086 family metal-binding protein [Kutzneria sp. CA-103260]QUQ67926.1 hypothetical protein JJ691_56640 [Kutzneria sp. CA-103260]
MSEFDVVDRYVLASAEFGRRLRSVGDWSAATPCTEWNVRQLVNHMVRGNLNYVALLHGGTGAEFLRMRDVDALGEDPVDAYERSMEAFANAFREPGALGRRVDYPLGEIKGDQALAIRTADTVIHTWDLARAVGGDEELNAELVEWMEENLGAIYEGLEGVERFFAPRQGTTGGTRQERLLRRVGR